MHRRTVLAIAAGCGLLAPAVARAANPCITDARQQFLDSQAECRESYQGARDDCFNRDHECVEVCRADRELCVDASGIEAALAACNAATRAAKATCRDQNPPDSIALDQCIDQVQVVGFQCRDAAREAARPALEACRERFAACARACPPPDPPSEAVDPRQCRRDARAAYRTCKGGAREDFQFQRDACRERDHDCVEACRAGRETCLEPVVAQHESDVAQCNLTRDQAVQTCLGLFPEGSPERDQCIDNAQVDAFRCRDQARESAKPGVLACQDQFRACAEACPPAS